MNRILNELADDSVMTIVVESLDFRLGGLSARLNRLMTRAGRSVVKAELASLREAQGGQIIEVNPAYSSQQCSGCGYVDRKNRTSQKRFRRRFCGKKLLADINAARNILGRSREPKGCAQLSKERVLTKLDQDFHARRHRDPARLRERPLRDCSSAAPS